MKNCKNCANAMYDERWGDYKCSIDGFYRYKMPEGCPDHKEGEPGISKGIENAD